MLFPLSGAEVNPFLLLGIGLAVGVCSGFFGFGGGFMTTPALNIFGFPMPYAIGTDMTQMAGSGFISTMKHMRFGHVDMRLAMCMIVGTMSGVELGKHIVMYLENVGNADMVIRWIYIFVLGALGLYMLREARRAVTKEKDNLLGAKKTAEGPTSLALKIRRFNLPPVISFPVSGIPRMSVWVPVGIGFITGLMAGVLGVGGGFIRMPTLVYLLGVPTVVAVGTDLFEIIISGAYGAFTYALANRVELLAAGIVLVGASIGVQFGATATRYVRAEKIRFFFAFTILFAGVSVLFKQLAAIYDISILNTISAFLLLGIAGGMSLIIIITFLTSRNAAMKAKRVGKAGEAITVSLAQMERVDR
jgi:uncharacterized membrane protein YfcA